MAVTRSVRNAAARTRCRRHLLRRLRHAIASTSRARWCGPKGRRRRSRDSRRRTKRPSTASPSASSRWRWHRLGAPPAAPRATPGAPRRTPGDQIRVRRRWVTGDRDGPQQWGEEEIEIERPADDRSSIRLWLGRK